MTQYGQYSQPQYAQPPTEPHHGLAIAGFVCAIVGAIFGLIPITFILAFIGAALGLTFESWDAVGRWASGPSVSASLRLPWVSGER